MSDNLQAIINDFYLVLVEAMLAPLQGVMLPEKRTFVLFLASSVVLVLFYLYQTGRLNRRYLVKVFFNSSYWLHPSAIKDYLWMFGNSFIKIAVFVPLLGSHLAGTILVASLLQKGLGDAPLLDVHTYAVIGLFSLSFFVLEDYSRFFLHRLMHTVPFLWKIHKIHHSAEVLTPFTLYRQHPIEMFLYMVRALLVFSLASGVFVWLFKGQVSGWAILGVDALGFLFNLAGAKLRHSHIWLSFGILEKWFISPAQHQIHHSRAPEHYNTNFGTCLAVWDRANVSWVPANNYRKLVFGLS